MIIDMTKTAMEQKIQKILEKEIKNPFTIQAYFKFNDMNDNAWSHMSVSSNVSWVNGVETDFMTIISEAWSNSANVIPESFGGDNLNFTFLCD